MIRRIVVDGGDLVVFFTFMLLHQSDKLLIGPLTTPIMETFDINEAQKGAVFGATGHSHVAGTDATARSR
jgi:hypothetical protein